MKANTLIKGTQHDITKIYNRIKEAHEQGEFKICIPHFQYIDDKIKLQLMDDGFKVYMGQWDGIQLEALIIEW